MNYYIEKPNTWRAANRKCAEIQEFVNQFKNCLIYDEKSRDALIKEIRDKVEELNNAYPRTKRLKVEYSSEGYLYCVAEVPKFENEYVFAFHFYPVKRTYDVWQSLVEINNDERARRYVDGVKKANPIDNPTWGLLETAFVAGMEEQQQMERRR